VPVSTTAHWRTTKATRCRSVFIGKINKPIVAVEPPALTPENRAKGSHAHRAALDAKLLNFVNQPKAAPSADNDF